MDAVSFVGNDVSEIYFYSDLRDLSGSTVVHRWEYGGEIMAEVPFEVTTDRWQVWSTKALSPNQLGDWTVSVVAPDGEILAVETLATSAPGDEAIRTGRGRLNPLVAFAQPVYPQVNQAPQGRVERIRRFDGIV